MQFFLRFIRREMEVKSCGKMTLSFAPEGVARIADFSYWMVRCGLFGIVLDIWKGIFVLPGECALNGNTAQFRGLSGKVKPEVPYPEYMPPERKDDGVFPPIPQESPGSGRHSTPVLREK